ncbi:hypothetical protein G7K_4982-t1 [Saitoella complicata NRRL Y-17804]|uniref:Chloride channel protein n=2 Tax=Saitoella complicata (strain BCRC 22490 / CBS 7301 / JCM 7358 / NBRC 10748 / NRRL Y-17804) TaxID=698492 RepID=A0A0E9NM41_SAICN|nr:hypothetical protein G7K_4982-t1 [Saitoella complicata NRRL Y-17804]
MALIMKIMLTVCTFGSAIPAGIFVPTMVVGSLIGRMVGLALHYVHLNHTLGFFEPNHSPAAYAMLGAAATLAGVTKMTVSLSVILFELTGSLDLVMPFMLTLLVSKWASDAIDRLSIYEKVINAKELPYLENHAIASIAEAAELLPPGRPREAITLELQGRYVSAFVLREKIDDLETLGEDDVGLCLVGSGLLRGYLGLKEIKACLELITDESALCTIDLEGPGNESLGIEWEQLVVDPANLTPYVNRTPLTLHHSAPVTLAFEMFNKLGLAYLCIMDGPDLVGVVTKKDILRYLKGR